MEKLTETIALISSILAAVSSFFGVFKNYSHKKEMEYYEKIVKPYILLSRKEDSEQAMNWLKMNAKREEECIPMYIHYLLENQKEEDLKKVLFVDYNELYKNEQFSQRKVLESLSRIMLYITMFLCIFLLVCSVLMILVGLIELVGFICSYFIKGFTFNVSFGNMLTIEIIGVLGFVYGLLLNYLNNRIYTDRYTLKLKNMKNAIKGKVKKYNKYRKNTYV